MPHINVMMLPGRSWEIKENLARKMKEVLVKELGVSEDIVSVSIEDVVLEDWNRSMERIRKDTIIIPEGMQ